MGKIIVSTQMTLDGVIQVGEWFGQRGEHDWHGPTGAAGHDQLRAADAMLLGRKTYEGLAGVWPSMTDDVGFADRVNSMPKFVASRSLQKPLSWNATLLEGDMPKSVATLKERTDGNLLSFGCGEFAHYLVVEGLVDEIRFWVNPYSWGSGERPFYGRAPISFDLVSTTTFDSGVVLLSYRPSGG